MKKVVVILAMVFVSFAVFGQQQTTPATPPKKSNGKISNVGTPGKVVITPKANADLEKKLNDAKKRAEDAAKKNNTPVDPK